MGANSPLRPEILHEVYTTKYTNRTASCSVIRKRKDVFHDFETSDYGALEHFGPSIGKLVASIRTRHSPRGETPCSDGTTGGAGTACRHAVEYSAPLEILTKSHRLLACSICTMDQHVARIASPTISRNCMIAFSLPLNHLHFHASSALKKHDSRLILAVAPCRRDAL